MLPQQKGLKPTERLIVKNIEEPKILPGYNYRGSQLERGKSAS